MNTVSIAVISCGLGLPEGPVSRGGLTCYLIDRGYRCKQLLCLRLTEILNCFFYENIFNSRQIGIASVYIDYVFLLFYVCPYFTSS